eukprot:TRINITY_DN11723_c0_g2_i1.p4 TRINITY_DN11723_c0_g2~~TRINITY_DN11723_c0_g2_i1.p4  ORF type:complete len:103 (+),score=17.70 TRINITY_DN11723_c0_g2_i1:2119-2427(+)
MMPLRYLLVALTGLLLVSARPGVLRKLRDYDLDAMLSRMKQPNYDVRTDTQAFEIMADAFSDYETLPLEDKLKVRSALPSLLGHDCDCIQKICLNMSAALGD